MTKHRICFFLTLCGFAFSVDAQRRYDQEIGIIAGMVEFRSDYGARNDFSTNIKNTGFGIGLVHSLGFTDASYFADHFKIRSEMSFNQTNLQHFGKWVENSNSPQTQKLKAMRGSTTLYNLGSQLEYHPLGIHVFENQIGSFSPYVSFGAQISYYNAKASSNLGELGTPNTTYSKYLQPSDGHPFGFSNEKKAVFSIVTSLGTRYKLNHQSDLLIDCRVQYFNSDWVDGLNPNKNLFSENKANDWLTWVNVGYLFYLDN
jgi:hypothetical protein